VELWWALLAVLTAALLTEIDLARGGDLRRSLYLVVHASMALVVVALSRISMRMVNRALEERGRPADFIARKPRRQLVLLAIALHAGAHWLAPGSASTGWLALAASAALLGLLSDWHLGAVLARRWVLMLYAVPWLAAGGYALQGVADLGAPVAASAALHVHALGAIGLAMFAVLNIAGRTHAGEVLDERPWLPAAAFMIVAAALTRAAAGIWTGHAMAGWMLSAALWTAAFAVWLAHAAPTMVRERRDGNTGCAGVAATD
jgi:uncharacterized protein involved in response to NO